MATITEDYCSYEVAKLLKEMGFDVPCLAHWFIGSETHEEFSDCPFNWNEVKSDLDWLSRPTLQMAMKWLREVHKISIEITSTGYLIDNDVEWECDIKAGRRLYFRHITNEKSFESCAEAAIKYCLENLI